MRASPRLMLVLLVSPAALLAGCGNSRTPLPSAQEVAAASSGFRELHYPTAGITLRAPTGWNAVTGTAPLIATITSGNSVVAVWRFPIEVRPPSGGRALRGAERRLIAKARERDPGIALIRSRVTRLAGAPAVELDAIEQIGGQQRRVRSTHVFERRAEIVLDEYAPPNRFHSIDHTVFSPVRRSLSVSPAA